MPHSRDKLQTYGIAWCGVCLVLAAGIHWLTADTPLRRVLANTVELCGGAAAISVPVGLLLALLLTRADVAGRRLSWLILLTLLFLPLHSTAAGWVTVFGKLGSQA